MNTSTDLRKLAHYRVEFRRHLVVFLIVNGVFWIIWFFTGKGYMWPVWMTGCWAIGLLTQFVFTYMSPRLFSEEEEFKRLEKEHNREDRVTGVH